MKLSQHICIHHIIAITHIRRGELLNEELSKNSLIRQDIEKQRYDILMNLKVRMLITVMMIMMMSS